MSAWTQVAGVTGLFLGLWLQVLGKSIRLARGCTCSKHAVDWRCPIHGSDAA